MLQQNTSQITDEFVKNLLKGGCARPQNKLRADSEQSSDTEKLSYTLDDV